MVVRDLLVQFFDAYLVRRDLEASLALLSEDVVSLGTGAQEVALGKQELRELMVHEFQSIPGGFRYEIRDYRENRYTDGLYGVYCGILAVMPDGDGMELSMQTRLTMTAAKLDGEWKIINLHMSTPSDQQEEEEFFPIQYGRQAVGKLDAAASKKLVEIMLSMLPGGIMGGYLEKGFPLYLINDTMLRYLGYTYEELVEATGEEMQKIIAPEDWDRVEQTIYESIQQTGGYDVQYRVIRKDGTRLWVDDKGHEITTEDGRKAMISVMLDINDSMRQQERLKQEVMEDALTGLLNRKGANLGLEKAMEKKEQGTLLMLDIDNFKQLNDTYGHPVGDQVLVLLGQIMRQYSREKDIVARIGGDEFILFLAGCTSEEVARKRAEQICSTFQKAGAQYDQVALSVSIGIAFSGGDCSPEHLIKIADDRLYAVKKSGKGNFQYDD